MTEGMRTHCGDKLDKLGKYSTQMIESHVVLKKEKYLYDAQITIAAKNFRAYGEGIKKDNVFSAIDQACERIEKQLKKFRERAKEHRKEHGEGAASPKVRMARKLAGEAAPEASRPAVIPSPDFAPKPMSVKEASLQLEVGKESFLVFLNSGTKRVNVIFKREDKNHGLIEPEF